jgi:hypothetical protein
MAGGVFEVTGGVGLGLGLGLGLMAGMCGGLLLASGGPSSAEARAVRDYIRERAPGARFVKWYPPLADSGEPFGERLRGEGEVIFFNNAADFKNQFNAAAMRAISYNGGKPWKMIRVRYRNAPGSQVVSDQLFYVGDDGKVFFHEDAEQYGRVVDPRGR